MADNIIITLGRQTGSGGHAIGEKLAELIGAKCYDKELLARAAQDSGIAEEIFRKHDEKPTSSFLYSLVMDNYALGYGLAGQGDMPINHKIFLAQFDSIKKIANQESCVIIGRCADYALSDLPNVVSVFITAEDEDKIKRLMERHNLTEEKARDLMQKSDKKRAGYYNYYSNKRWGEAKSYDMTINSSALGIDGTAEVILAFAKKKLESINNG